MESLLPCQAEPQFTSFFQRTQTNNKRLLFVIYQLSLYIFQNIPIDNCDTMGKKPSAQPAPRVYRDEPDRDDAASTSSAVPLEGVYVHENDHENAFPDAELPAYEDVPSLPSTRSAAVRPEREQPA